jgi:hypothetical protein
MDLKTVYTKTGKGVLEVKSKSLPKDLGKVLSLIDGKSNVGDILGKGDKLPEAKVKEFLQKLETDGYIRIFSTGPQTMFAGGGDLDFTGLVVSEAKPSAFNEAKAQQEARNKPVQDRAKIEAEAKAKAALEAKLRAEAEAKARKETEEKARKEAEEKARREAEEKARREAEARVKAEAEVRARVEAERKAKAEAAERAKSEEEARRKTEAELKTRIEAEARAKIEAEIRAKAEAESRAKSQAKKEDDDLSRMLAGIEAKTNAEEEARRRAEAEEKTKKETHHAKSEEEDWAKAEAEIRASIEETARKKAGAELDFGPLTDMPPLTETPPLADLRKDEEVQEARNEAAKHKEHEAKERAKAEEKAKKEAEAHSRREAKEKARAEEETRRQAEKEEKARAKAVAKSMRRPFNWKPVIIGSVVLLAAAVGLVQVVPLNNYIPKVEKLVSDSLQEPVTITNLRVSLIPTPQVNLEGVIIGKLKDFKIETVKVPGLGLISGGGNALGNVEMQGITLEQDTLPRVAAWGKSSGQTLQFERVTFKNVRLALNNIQLAPLNGEFRFSGGAPQSASLRTMDGKISAQVSAKGGQFEVTVSAKDWQLPLGPEIIFDYLDAKGTATSESLQITDIDAKLYGGNAIGSATLEWGGAWNLSGSFEAKGLDLGPVLNIFARNFSMAGRLDARINYDMRAPAPEKLFAAPQVQGTFAINRGSLNNVDLIRALQEPSREGIRGGKTLFDEFVGNLQYGGGHYKFGEMKLVSGPLTATGNADISPEKQISGRASVELKSKATYLKNSYSVSGNLNDLVLRQQ